MIYNDYRTGTWLRSIRLYNSLTQEEMAKFMGTNRGTYSSWESRYKHKHLPSYVISRAILFSVGTHRMVIVDTEDEEKESIFTRIWKWIMRKN